MDGTTSKGEQNMVAQTILNQLGGKHFALMTGSKNFVGSKDSLTFRVGRNPKGIQVVKVTLTPADMYDVQFIKARGVNVRVAAEIKEIFAEDLKDAFFEGTGLYASLYA
jgi:hypothetical protein